MNVNPLSLLGIISKGYTYGAIYKDGSINAVSKWDISPKAIKGRKEFAKQVIEFARFKGISDQYVKELADIRGLKFKPNNLFYAHSFRDIAVFKGNKITLIDAYRLVQGVNLTKRSIV